MIVWAVFTTDGDSGYYNVMLFSTEVKALDAKKKLGAYARMEQMQVY